jgi:DNA polymerase-3 subunit epsilon
VCTHEIARRLLPGMPRLGLRALAGYFGHGAEELRRSHGHVWATAHVWQHIVGALQDEGIDTLEDLERWLTAPVPRATKRRYPMPRELRLRLPEGPGVYRMLRTSGDVLYVGKATSLRRRVNTYFQKQTGVSDRMLELLSQARDLDVTPTASALEAALLESDEIKRLAPPFNLALLPAQRATWFCAPGLVDPATAPSRLRRRGPFGSRWHLRRFAAVQALLGGEVTDAGGSDETRRVILTALGRPTAVEVDPDILRSGATRFGAAMAARGLHGPLAEHDVMRVGAQMWRAAGAARAIEPDEEPAAEDAPWDAADVHERLDEVLLVAAHALRRARWLCGLLDASVAFVDGNAARLLVLEAGRLTEQRDFDPADPLPVPPGTTRTATARRRAFDVATYDRLRVLTTELRRVADTGAPVAVRWSTRRAWSGERLRRVLAWV